MSLFFFILHVEFKNLYTVSWFTKNPVNSIIAAGDKMQAESQKLNNLDKAENLIDKKRNLET